MSTDIIRLIKGGGRGYGGGGGRRLYTYRYSVTTKMTPALRWAVMRAIPFLTSFANVTFEKVPTFIGLTMTLSNQERLSSASSFHTSLLQVTDGVMYLALCVCVCVSNVCMCVCV